ncbi:monovalent cation/H+ antiporter complex subunit F [Pseudogemmobacter bohemicus]|uniref:monovalent cation/H+ antiporter complex subunit F n=1 Tax=Pseudogemmobacter bohemicus TaxID=2250708 RepID=UPI000DD3425C|nr:monovalent cation/H+ antiporter complex subunit F [Pseudogemmobacter bohemicus]
MTAATFLELCLRAGMALMVLAVLLGLVRLWKGPSLGDRVVALDMMSVAVIGFCALFALQSGVQAYLDIVVAVALVSFVPVVALARYAERLARREGADD